MYRILIPTVAALLFMILVPAATLLITGDFPGSTAFYGLPEDHQMVDFLFNLRGK